MPSDFELPKTLNINLNVHFHTTNQLEKLMSALTDLATAFAANIGTNSSAANTAAIAQLQTQVAAILASEQTDEAKTADIVSALGIAFAAPTPANPVPTPPATPVAGS